MTETGIKNVENLQTLTSYLLRVILITEQNESYENDSVPTVSCKTACLSVSESDIKIEVRNTSAKFTINVSFTVTLLFIY